MKTVFARNITESLSTEINLSRETLETQLPKQIKTELISDILYLPTKRA